MPFLFYYSSLELEPEPIIQEDMDKLTDQIRELNLENAQPRFQLSRTKEHNYALEDKGKQVCEEFTTNKKRLKEVEGQRIWVGGALLGANFELDACNENLDQAYRTIRDLEKTIERSNAINKEAREDYEAQILELRTNLKDFKDLLAKEQLEREKIRWSLLHNQFNLGRAY